MTQTQAAPREYGQVTPRILTSMMDKIVARRAPLLVTGAPGLGKTSIASQVAAKRMMDFIPTHPVVEDVTDSKGVPMGDLERMMCHWLIDGTLKQLCDTDRPTLWLIDDLGQANPQVQAVYMQWLLNRAVAGHKLSEHVSIVACTNDRTHNAGVQGILDPVKSRFITILELLADIDDWATWAYGNGVSPELIAFLRS